MLSFRQRKSFSYVLTSHFPLSHNLCIYAYFAYFQVRLWRLTVHNKLSQMYVCVCKDGCVCVLHAVCLALAHCFLGAHATPKHAKGSPGNRQSQSVFFRTAPF